MVFCTIQIAIILVEFDGFSKFVNISSLSAGYSSKVKTRRQTTNSRIDGGSPPTAKIDGWDSISQNTEGNFMPQETTYQVIPY